MKGIVFNLLEEVVTSAHGADVWDALIDQAGVPGAYTSLGSYPDEEMMRLVETACVNLRVSQQHLLQWFGRNAMPLMASRYPEFFRPFATAKDMIVSVNSIIHPEVRKIYPGAEVPMFRFDDIGHRSLVMRYNSRRKLCALAEGFAQGAADHYNENVSFKHTFCMHRSSDFCEIHMVFAPKRDVALKVENAFA